jgi:hypothetical protein
MAVGNKVGSLRGAAGEQANHHDTENERELCDSEVNETNRRAINRRTAELSNQGLLGHHEPPMIYPIVNNAPSSRGRPVTGVTTAYETFSIGCGPTGTGRAKNGPGSTGLLNASRIGVRGRPPTDPMKTAAGAWGRRCGMVGFGGYRRFLMVTQSARSFRGGIVLFVVDARRVIDVATGPRPNIAIP